MLGGDAFMFDWSDAFCLLWYFAFLSKYVKAANVNVFLQLFDYAEDTEA